MNGVYTFEIEGLWISAVTDGEKVVLIDCGYPGYADRIEEALREAQIDPGKLTHILITHHDEDHIGSLREMADRHPSAVILTSETEKPYLLGEKKALRLADYERAAANSEGDRAYYEMVKAIPHVEHVEIVKEGDVLPVCGGIEIIATPGHMDGHISAYVRGEKCLIPGDAIGLTEDGKLRANPVYTMNMPEAVKSARKLLAFDIESIRCYHGGVLEGNVREALEEMIREQG